MRKYSALFYKKIYGLKGSKEDLKILQFIINLSFKCRAMSLIAPGCANVKIHQQLQFEYRDKF